VQAVRVASPALWRARVPGEAADGR
jgi:hypothetical protein